MSIIKFCSALVSRHRLALLLLLVALLTGNAWADPYRIYVINDSQEAVTISASSRRDSGAIRGRSIPSQAKGFLTRDSGSPLTERDRQKGSGMQLIDIEELHFNVGERQGTIKDVAELKDINGEQCWVILIQGEL